MQIRSTVSKVGSYPLDKIEAQNELVTVFVKEQQAMEQELVSLQKEVKTVESQKARLTSGAVRRELDAKRRELGLEAVLGSGVSIFISDSQQATRGDDVNDGLLVRPSDVRDVINLLFNSSAAAISVNGRRVTPLSSINFVGNSFLVDGFRTFTPFVIEAIGPQSALRSKLQNSDLLPDIHRRLKQ
ncbi:MAG: DUF881 domain-containing protein, partial [Patescibacteria group bacterium]